MLTVRSASGDGGLLATCVVAVVDEVKFCADFVPVTLAVLFIVVPLGAVTLPVVVTVQYFPPRRPLSALLPTLRWLTRTRPSRRATI